MQRPLFLLLLGVLGCLKGDLPLEPLPSGGHHVLFIGNSLTYVNDLPGTLSRVATLAGDTIRVRSVAEPDFAVIDHALGASNAVDVIEGEKWEYVILQQGPTPLPLFRDTLVRATRLLDPPIRAAGATSAQFLTWTPKNRPDIYADVVESCRQAAEAVGESSSRWGRPGGRRSSPTQRSRYTPPTDSTRLPWAPIWRRW